MTQGNAFEITSQFTILAPSVEDLKYCQPEVGLSAFTAPKLDPGLFYKCPTEASKLIIVHV